MYSKGSKDMATEITKIAVLVHRSRSFEVIATEPSEYPHEHETAWMYSFWATFCLWQYEYQISVVSSEVRTILYQSA